MNQRRHDDVPVFVVGVPRSGTSAVAGCLHQCGVWIGQTSLSQRAEIPRGDFEHLYLRDAVNKHILRSIDYDPHGVRWLPPLDAHIEAQGLREMVLARIREEGYRGEIAWLFKDPKLALLWRAWQVSFPAARWVIVRRNSADIVLSCLRTQFMVQHSSDPEFWKGYVADYRDRIEALKQSGADCREIDFDYLMHGDFEQLHQLVNALELSWKESAVKSFINSKHWHGNRRQLLLPFSTAERSAGPRAPLGSPHVTFFSTPQVNRSATPR